jgi:hypothetical protein
MSATTAASGAVIRTPFRPRKTYMALGMVVPAEFPMARMMVSFGMITSPARML